MVIWLLLPHGAARPGVEAPPFFEVEMVDQAQTMAGTPAETPSKAAPPPPQPETPPLPADPASPTSPVPMPEQPAPQQTISATHDTKPQTAPAPDSSVNLSGADSQDQESLLVTGDNVVPPRPDAAYVNKPPHYPADAIRRHAEGTVTLMIHVTENGLPGWVDVAQSSGDTSLDREAREAVALWRFQPATDRGVPVPIDVPIRISFSFGRPGRALP